jgi:EpsI family protein
LRRGVLDGTGPYPSLSIDLQPAADWEPVPDRLTDWTPHFLHPQAQLKQIYAKDGRRVGLYIGYYRNQREGSQLVSSQNTLVVSDNKEWGNIGEMHRIIVVANERIPLIEARLRGRSAQLLVWRWYWVDGQYVVNPYWAKLLQAKSRLLGRSGDGGCRRRLRGTRSGPGGGGRSVAGFRQQYAACHHTEPDPCPLSPTLHLALSWRRGRRRVCR